jgi:hypothetical protein
MPACLRTSINRHILKSINNKKSYKRNSQKYKVNYIIH